MESKTKITEDENIINQEEVSQNSYDLSEEKIKKPEPPKSKKIKCGSSTLHILPIKLKDKISCQRKAVDEYFEKFIAKNEDQKNGDYDCALFRGRVLNGKKINIENNDNFKINYVELMQEDESNNNEYKTLINRKVNEYYVWKYDQLIEKDNNLLMLEKNMKKLDILS